jgi:hypothetical protein
MTINISYIKQSIPLPEYLKIWEPKMYLYNIMAWYCEICAKRRTYIEILNYTFLHACNEHLHVEHFLKKTESLLMIKYFWPLYRLFYVEFTLSSSLLVIFWKSGNKNTLY